MKDRGLQLGQEKRLPLVGVTRGWNVRWGRASFLQFFFFLAAYRGEDASGQGHEPLYYFWNLQKQGGWDGPWRRVELQIVSSKVSDQALRINRWIDR
jgi:hypothetical protein